MNTPLPKPRRRTLIAVSVLLAVGLCFSVTRGWSWAEPPKQVETLIPSGTVLTIAWDGFEQHQEAWQKTAAYESIVKSGLGSAVEQFVRSLITAAGQRGLNPEENQDLQTALKVAETLARRGLSAYVGFTEESPFPWAVIVAHGGGDLLPVITPIVKKAAGRGLPIEESSVAGRTVYRAAIPHSPGIEIGWWRDGGHLVIAVGQSIVERAIAVADGKQKSITASPVWQTQSKPAEFETLFHAWIDMASIRKKFNDFPVPIGRGENPSTVGKIAEILGVEKLGTISYRWGFQEKAIVSEAKIEAPAPRRKLLSLFDGRPIKLKDLPPLPAQSHGFAAASFDFGNFYDVLLLGAKEFARLDSTTSEQNVEMVEPALNGRLGIDVRRELLNSLGSTVCVYSDPSQSFFGLGFGVAVSVRDAKMLRSSIDRLWEALSDVVRNDNVDLRRTKRGERELLTFVIGGGFLNPTLSIDDKWMIIGLTPQGVDAYLLRLEQKLPTWSPRPEEQAVLDKMPKEFTSITLTDPRSGYETLIGLAGAAAPMIQAAVRSNNRQPISQPPAVIAFPPTELVIAPLFPNIAVMTVDDDGITARSRSSLPTVPFIGAAGAAPMLPLAAAFWGHAQSPQVIGAAPREDSKNHLKQIGLALHSFHDLNRAFPAGTQSGSGLPMEKRLSWLAPILPFVEQPRVFGMLSPSDAWNSDQNKQSSQTHISVYQRPGGEAEKKDGYPVTHYVGLGGLGKDGPTLPVSDPKAGAFGYDRKTKVADFKDGTSNTMIVSEASGNLGPWSAGGPATVRPVTQDPFVGGKDGFGGSSPDGCLVLMADGSVRTIDKKIDPKALRALVTINGGEKAEKF